MKLLCRCLETNQLASYPGLALKAKRFNAFEQGDDESL